MTEQYGQDAEQIAPAANACRTVEAPPAMATSLWPAAAFACVRAASKPAVTKSKWNVVHPPSLSAHGVVGKDEHRRMVGRRPTTGASPPHSPRIGPNMLRSMTCAPPRIISL
jgi:hypothetical protein